MEISLEASWVGVQRHGQDLADRLAQGFSGLLLHAQPPQLPPWSPAALLPPKLVIPFDLDLPVVPFVAGMRRGVGTVDLPAVAVSSLVEIGGRLGQAGSELGAAVQHLARQVPVPVPFRKWEAAQPPTVVTGDVALAVGTVGSANVALERAVDIGSLEVAAAAAAAATGSATAGSVGAVGAMDDDRLDDEEDGFDCEIGTLENIKKAKGTVNVSATYNTRHHDFESSVVARGDLWRLESSRGNLTSGNDSSPLFLVQLGPLLFVRDSTLLLPVHLSKQHLLWYGYDRKNGMHSLCPAIWSKHRKWMLMSMMCLNPVACSFMDVQFPNGQMTYVAGEGITASGFIPLFGGLLQAHAKCPGDTRVSFSFKNKQGTRFSPTFQWPDNSVSFGVAQAVAWKRSGLMVRPSIQISVCPTFGGTDPGICTEFVHSLKEEVSVMCGFSCSRHPSAFTALSLGRSKWNGQVGSSGLVITLETPLDNMARPSLSVQLNGGFEF
ncbi:uncharacterized protein LOC100276949 [Zea mays]|uniref:Epstein-Barr nuclear antigen 2 n=2 Tax=Zea mays TaxID=4577 RepID=B6TLI8_MAIZE|nr:uncharacterized protein LOC100276949 [Zea mays]ACG37971.1 hypothetical protein [Zea mays]ACN29167.1 unknown [Zea mays]AQK87706.1 hypothetical protein ZEAMMB73_Zm00001d038747 [Zea mays]|eukprot:NP_001144109.1 uncharacterized protein LOC100276949 [Zea mays]